MLIYLVRNNECIVFLCKIGDYLQFFTSEDLAAGIGRIAEYKSFRVLSESGFKHICIEAELGRDKRNVYRLGSRKYGIRAVILVKRREHNYLVTGICNGHHCRHHSLCTAAGNDYLAVRVDSSAHETGLLLRKSFTEILCAPCYGVLVEVLAGDFGKTVKYLSRRFKVGKSL